MVLLVSSAGVMICVASCNCGSSFSRGRQSSCVCSSVRMNSLSKWMFLIVFSTSAGRLLLLMIVCIVYNSNQLFITVCSLSWHGTALPVYVHVYLMWKTCWVHATG